MPKAKEAVTVLAYAGCQTCKNALKWLAAEGVTVHVRPIVDEPPTPGELKKWIAASGIGVRKWLNTSGQSYRALGKAKVDAATDAERFFASPHGAAMRARTRARVIPCDCWWND